MNIILKGIPSAKKNNKQIVYNKKTGKPFLISSKKHSEWHMDAMNQLRTKSLPMGIEEAKIQVDFYMPNLIRRDLSNLFESVADLLVDFGVLTDDNWRVLSEVTLTGQLDRENPRTVVQITDVEKSI